MKSNMLLYSFLSLRFMTYAASFIVGKLFLEKNVIKSRVVIEIFSNLDIALIMEWN